MARITVEDCLKQVDNRFGLIHLAARRVRQLRKGSEPLVVCKNKDIVTALREIAAGKVVPVEKTAEKLPDADQLFLEAVTQPLEAASTTPDVQEETLSETTPETAAPAGESEEQA